MYLPPTAGVRLLTRNGEGPVVYRQTSNARRPSRQDLECRSSLKKLGRSKPSVGRALKLLATRLHTGSEGWARRNAKSQRRRGIEAHGRA